MPAETVYISIGSNIDPEKSIPKAVRLLHECAELKNLTISSFYKSKAVGPTDQPDYRNGVARFNTDIEPETLKKEILRRIESQCGRIRQADRYAPRTLDLDIILFGNRILVTNSITIPDPAIWEHDFVTIPLLEIEPTLIIPGRKTTLSSLNPGTLQKDHSLNTLIQKGNHNG